MMSPKVTLLMVHGTPRTAHTSLASSMSQPTRSPVFGSTNSFGAYEASEAIWSGAAFLIADGTSDAMFAWTVGPVGPELAGEEPPDPPHAASNAAGTRRASPARRETWTVRPICDPQNPSN